MAPSSPSAPGAQSSSWVDPRVPARAAAYWPSYCRRAVQIPHLMRYGSLLVRCRYSNSSIALFAVSTAQWASSAGAPPKVLSCTRWADVTGIAPHVLGPVHVVTKGQRAATVLGLWRPMQRRTGVLVHEAECAVVELRGGRVVLPATGEHENLKPVSTWHDAEGNLDAFATRFYSMRHPERMVRTTAVLVHRADNSYNPNAISVSIPKAEGGSRDERHLGYLYDAFLRRVGMSNLPDLIGFAGGEVECTVVLEGRDNLSVDLPAPAVLGEAIRTFLAGHGVQAAGAPRPSDAPREFHAHSDKNPLTARTLSLLGTHTEEALTVTGLHMATVKHWDAVEVRTLKLTDKTSGRALGVLDNQWLRLDDERDRDNVLALLDREGIQVNRPVTNPKVGEDRSWTSRLPPNVRARLRPGGLDLRVHDPADPSSQESFAIYNPSLDVLWVEDSRLVAPALRFMHRQGIDVAEVGLPRRSWGLDTEIPYRSLRNPEKPWRHEWQNPTLLRSVRSLIPSGILMDDTVTWVSEVPRSEPSPSFSLLERYVHERLTLFPTHSLTDEVGQCRLCDGHATVFTTPIATEPLVYCQTCLANAVVGLVEVRARASVALRELSRLEFDGRPMLATQLESLHINPEEPVDAKRIDRLLLLRFGIARKRVAWTLLLEAAGFAEDGLRTARGTLIRSRDGHLCLSMRERAVCDFLHQHSLQHDHEPLYPHDPDYNPNGLRRADWVLADGTLVEFWGSRTTRSTPPRWSRSDSWPDGTASGLSSSSITTCRTCSTSSSRGCRQVQSPPGRGRRCLWHRRVRPRRLERSTAAATAGAGTTSTPKPSANAWRGALKRSSCSSMG